MEGNLPFTVTPSIVKKYIINLKQHQMLDDDDIPTVKDNESIEEWEVKNGRGFWGNDTTGHIYNNDK